MLNEIYASLELFLKLNLKMLIKMLRRFLCGIESTVRLPTKCERSKIGEDTGNWGTPIFSHPAKGLQVRNGPE